MVFGIDAHPLALRRVRESAAGMVLSRLLAELPSLLDGHELVVFSGAPVCPEGNGVRRVSTRWPVSGAGWQALWRCLVLPRQAAHESIAVLLCTSPWAAAPCPRVALLPAAVAWLAPTGDYRGGWVQWLRHALWRAALRRTALVLTASGSDAERLVQALRLPFDRVRPLPLHTRSGDAAGDEAPRAADPTWTKAAAGLRFALEAVARGRRAGLPACDLNAGIR